MTDPHIERWRSWLEESIRPHIYTINLHRYVYEELGKITADRDLPASYFFDFVIETYAVSQAVAVRRLADRNQKVISLASLLKGIAAKPSLLTREFYVGLYDSEDERAADRNFDTHFAGASKEHLDHRVVAADLETLRAGAQGVKDYVDQYLAHLDRAPKAAPQAPRA